MPYMRSTTGDEVHVALVELGHATRIGTDWTEVHDRFVIPAMRLGCVTKENFAPAPEAVAEVPEKSAKELIRDALIELNEKQLKGLGYFTKEGLPNLKKVSMLANFMVQREDMMEVFYELKEQGIEIADKFADQE